MIKNVHFLYIYKKYNKNTAQRIDEKLKKLYNNRRSFCAIDIKLLKGDNNATKDDDIKKIRRQQSNSFD
jgi:hypothetical protein